MEVSQKVQRLFRLMTALAIVASMVLSPVAGVTANAATEGTAQFQQADAQAPDLPSGRDALNEADVELMTPALADKSALGTVSAAGVQVDTYIVVLEGEALATYDGGVNGLAATSPRVTGREKLNPRSPESLAYLAYLEQQQADVIIQMERTFGRDVEIPYRYQAALNGFAAVLTPNEATRLSKFAGVKRVTPDWIETKQTDSGPTWQGAPTIWGGDFTNLSYKAELSGASEVPAVETAASGLGSFTYNMDTKELTYEVSVADISGITASHIHAAPAGANGGVLFPLFTGSGAFDPENPISGTVTLNMEQQALLVNGGLYVNVHTSAHPSGEIRGQILLNGSMG